MALVIYPTTDYDTFCSLADAETIILNQIPYEQRKDKWSAIADITDDLTADEQKEVLLRQATLLIKQEIGTVGLPETLENDLKVATAFLANHSISVDMQNEDGSGNIQEKRIEGVVTTKYFNPREDNSNDLPDVIVSLISQYKSSGSSSFTFSRS